MFRPKGLLQLWATTFLFIKNINNINNIILFKDNTTNIIEKLKKVRNDKKDRDISKITD